MINRVASVVALGRVLAAGLRNVRSPREVMKESIEETGRAVVHDLERFLTTLGTIASISPLMGLFGTVVGMIEIFGSPDAGRSNPSSSPGISIALYNTGFGLVIAIPSMIFWRTSGPPWMAWSSRWAAGHPPRGSGPRRPSLRRPP